MTATIGAWPARKRRSSGTAFTVELPRTIEVRKDGDAWWTEVGGRELRLSNLDKLYWPDEGYTKGDLVALLRERRRPDRAAPRRRARSR